MKHPSSHLHSRRKKRRKGDTDQLAAQLAPLEEQDRLSAERQLGAALTSAPGQPNQTPGAIVVDSDYQGIAKDIIEARGETRFLGMEPVVLVVLIIMLVFIAFIAWQITLMPQ